MLIVLRLFCKKPPAEVGGLSKGVIKQSPQLAYNFNIIPYPLPSYLKD